MKPRPFLHANPTALDPLLVLAEVEHRVANEFALAIASIELIARTCEGRAKQALTQAAARLWDHAQAHRALLPPLPADMIDLSGYLRKVFEALTRASLAERGISLSLHETPIDIETWRAWRVGLILTELISNSVRHGVWPAGGGAIRVEITSGDYDVYCRVTDNGQGSKTPSRGTGTHIVDALVTEICGHIHREFRTDGVTVLLTLPRVHPVARHADKRFGKVHASFAQEACP